MGKSRKTVDAGRAPHVPLKEKREQVERLAACGLDVAQIAYVLETDPLTVKEVYAAEIEHGAARVAASVGAALVDRALAGDTNAARFFLQARAGWVPATKVQHTGKGDGPIEVEEKRGLVEAILSHVRPETKAEGRAQSDTGREAKH